MNVLIRTDSSLSIGAGHVMRCLALSDELRQRGAQVGFICRVLKGNIIGLIEQKGYRVYRLPNAQDGWMADFHETKSAVENEGKSVDWMIVDHYAIDRAWESRLRAIVKRIMVIDDIADREHDCDVLLDQNHYETLNIRYNGLASERCQMLLGPTYALLRPEFRSLRKTLRRRDGKVNRILVFLGGMDPTNETAKAVEALGLLNRSDMGVTVVVGASNSRKSAIAGMCASLPQVTYYCQPNNVAQLMADADLSVGAGGSTTWERCCLGLPTIIISVAQNQKAIAEGCHQKGIGVYIGEAKDVSPMTIKLAIEKVISDRQVITMLSSRAYDAVDGRGVCRVSDILLDQQADRRS